MIRDVRSACLARVTNSSREIPGNHSPDVGANTTMALATLLLLLLIAACFYPPDSPDSPEESMHRSLIPALLALAHSFPFDPFHRGQGASIWQLGRIPFGRGGGKTRAAVRRSRQLRGKRK